MISYFIKFEKIIQAYYFYQLKKIDSVNSKIYFYNALKIYAFLHKKNCWSIQIILFV